MMKFQMLCKKREQQTYTCRNYCMYSRPQSCHTHNRSVQKSKCVFCVGEGMGMRLEMGTRGMVESMGMGPGLDTSGSGRGTGNEARARSLMLNCVV